MEVRPLGPDDSVTLDQFWRCPICETTIASGPPCRLSPPRCGMGHPLAEMEQVNADGFMASREES